MPQRRVRAAPRGPPSPRPGVRRSPQRAPVMKRVALFLPEDLPLEEWRRIGDNIAVLADSSTWWLGDWLVYGQRPGSGRGPGGGARATPRHPQPPHACVGGPRGSPAPPPPASRAYARTVR